MMVQPLKRQRRSVRRLGSPRPPSFVSNDPGQDGEPANAEGTVEREIASIERKNAADLLALGDPHKSRVGQIHRQIAILSHQDTHARDAVGGQRKATEGTESSGSLCGSLTSALRSSVLRRAGRRGNELPLRKIIPIRLRTSDVIRGDGNNQWGELASTQRLTVARRSFMSNGFEIVA